MAYLQYFFFFFNDTATTEIYTLSLHDALPILRQGRRRRGLQSFLVHGLRPFAMVSSMLGRQGRRHNPRQQARPGDSRSTMAGPGPAKNAEMEIGRAHV